jgi:hypothetical protein
MFILNNRADHHGFVMDCESSSETQNKGSLETTSKLQNKDQSFQPTSEIQNSGQSFQPTSEVQNSGQSF